MKKRIMSGLPVYSLVLAMIALVVGGCAAPAAAPPPAATPSPEASTPPVAARTVTNYTVKVMNKAGIGNYLADAKGMTLYRFNMDEEGKSNATSAILQTWPVFNVPNLNLVLPSPLKAADFGTITTNGQQTTYKGWPLYYYVNDIAPGDTLGQRVNNVWFVLDPYIDSINLNSSRSN
jgi:predicted lipoprotein with Yx(FWY)xxD motif